MQLSRAASLLPESPSLGVDGGTLSRFQGWLEHNELELALDELIDLGESNPVPQGYWEELLNAARGMSLESQAKQIHALMLS